jgi:Mrp family chromosome partitioning ATPase
MAISERTGRVAQAQAISRGTGNLVTDAGCPPEQVGAYRQAFLNTRFAMLNLGGTSLLISAVDGTAGAATPAANFAILAAQEGERVILVDGDLHAPTLDRQFNIAGSPGVSELIRRTDVDAVSALQPVDLGTAARLDLRVLGAGQAGGIPGGIGRAPGLRSLIESLKAAADRLIVIGTPILTHVDSMDLSGLVDGVVVVLTPGYTHREDAAKARQVLDRVQAPVIGVVLANRVGNDSPPAR